MLFVPHYFQQKSFSFPSDHLHFDLQCALPFLVMEKISRVMTEMLSVGALRFACAYIIIKAAFLFFFFPFHFILFLFSEKICANFASNGKPCASLSMELLPVTLNGKVCAVTVF